MTNRNLPVFVFAVVFFFVVIPINSDGETTYSGSEVCTECHEDVSASFSWNSHGIKGDPRTPAAKQGCESCHGPGAAHVDDGGAGEILSLGLKSFTPAGEKNAVCLRCHTKGRQVFWPGSEHEARGLSCSDCHRIHSKNPNYLVKPSQTTVCERCHKRIRSELLRQSHHPVREGKIRCSDCHNSHGTTADKLVDAQYVNLKCFECHAEKRGPFLWEHPPVVEDCLACHTPHGSFRGGLLKGKTPYLCQRCHANADHSGVNELFARSSGEVGSSVYTALSNRAFYRGCLNCHIAMHGSNHPSGKDLIR